MDSEDKEIDSIEAVNLTQRVQLKSLKNQEGEITIRKFIQNGWLKYGLGESVVRLAPRFLAEMEPFLIENYEVPKCEICKSIVVRVIIN